MRSYKSRRTYAGLNGRFMGTKRKLSKKFKKRNKFSIRRKTLKKPRFLKGGGPPTPHDAEILKTIRSKLQNIKSFDKVENIDFTDISYEYHKLEDESQFRPDTIRDLVPPMDVIYITNLIKFGKRKPPHVANIVDDNKVIEYVIGKLKGTKSYNTIRSGIATQKNLSKLDDNIAYALIEFEKENNVNLNRQLFIKNIKSRILPANFIIDPTDKNPYYD